MHPCLPDKDCMKKDPEGSDGHLPLLQSPISAGSRLPLS